MLYRIRHTIRLEYSTPVFLEPLTIRLRPRTDASQHLRRFVLDITPRPAGRSDSLDFHDNVVTLAWFEGLHSLLELTALSEIHLIATKPFDYLITDPEALTLPMRYNSHSAAALEPYQAREALDPAVDKLAHQLMQSANSRTTDFLFRVALYLQEELSMTLRLEGPAQPPSETLSRGEGACRDLAVLFMDLCRSVGIAARFVSGYKLEAPETSENEGQLKSELHAWVEAYLPGAGWRGYDPGTGTATESQHVAIATSPAPAGAAPTEGSFRGSAKSKLEFQVEIENI